MALIKTASRSITNQTVCFFGFSSVHKSNFFEQDHCAFRADIKISLCFFIIASPSTTVLYFPATCHQLCLNGGTCVAPNLCHCPYGYQGDDCSQSSSFFFWWRTTVSFP